MASRDPAHLAPALRTQHDIWLHDCRKAGLDPLVTCTYRPQSEQTALYAQGRTTPGKIVTWTLTSRHSAVRPDGTPAAEAFDFVPLVAGKPVWDAKHPHWSIAGTLAERLGLQWGGRWTRKRDLPHIQLP